MFVDSITDYIRHFLNECLPCQLRKLRFIDAIKSPVPVWERIQNCQIWVPFKFKTNKNHIKVVVSIVTVRYIEYISLKWFALPVSSQEFFLFYFVTVKVILKF